MRLHYGVWHNRIRKPVKLFFMEIWSVADDLTLLKWMDKVEYE